MKYKTESAFSESYRIMLNLKVFNSKLQYSNKQLLSHIRDRLITKSLQFSRKIFWKTTIF